MQRTIRNGPSEEENTEAADEASNKTAGTRELARWCRNTAQDQHSKASLMRRARSSIFRWYSTYCISVLTTNMHLSGAHFELRRNKAIAS